MPVPVVALDASVWLSRILRTDVNRPLARAWISNHIQSGGTFVAPHLLVVETAATVRRVTGRERHARRALNELLTIPYLRLLPIDQQLVEDAAEIAISLGLKSGDSFYVAVAKQLNIPLVTFDNEQLTRPAGVIATIRP
ncbi:MAG TPA: type II toxin-antitoxin system VapC family toxin [Chloroflexia bacterium]